MTTKVKLISSFTLILIFVLQSCNLPTKSLPSSLTETAIAGEKTSASPTEPHITASPLQPELPEPETTSQVFLPIVEAPEKTETPQKLESSLKLAYLSKKDVFLIQLNQDKPHQVTNSSDILSFGWSKDGESLATFNGKDLCFYDSNGNANGDCISLSLEGIQTQIERRVIWSKDSKFIALWNFVNPWDEGAIGWVIVPLEKPNESIYIEDPVDWGAELSPDNEPGGITGEPVFIGEHTLIGTLTHRWLCGSGGCHYQLFEFDLGEKIFKPYANNPQDGWSEGEHLALTGDSSYLFNYGTFHAGCDSYITFVDKYHLQNKERSTYNFEQESIFQIAPSLQGDFAVLARGAGCSTENTQTWDETCGLTQGFDIYPLQYWEISANVRTDLHAGIFPTVSPDNKYLAFQSCLAPKSDGTWEPDASIEMTIYILNLETKTIEKTIVGQQPQWQP